MAILQVLRISSAFILIRLILQCICEPGTLLDKYLLLLLQLFHKFQRHFQCLRNDIWRCQCEPLRKRNIGNAIRLVYLYPDKIFCF